MSYQVKVPLRSLPNFKFLFSDKGYLFFFSAYKTMCHKKIELKETKRNKTKQKTNKQTTTTTTTKTKPREAIKSELGIGASRRTGVVNGLSLLNISRMS